MGNETIYSQLKYLAKNTSYTKMTKEEEISSTEEFKKGAEYGRGHTLYGILEWIERCDIFNLENNHIYQLGREEGRKKVLESFKQFHKNCTGEEI